jgi:regulatory protein
MGARQAPRRARRPGESRAPLDERRARLVAADLLSRRAWTRAELTRRLRRRGAPAEVAAGVVGDLVTRGHVDDAAFARQWVASRSARGYGAGRLRAELSVRGVSGPLIDAALAESDVDAALERARAVAARRLPALRGGDPQRIAARLRDHLLRRGYSASVVVRVVRETLRARLADLPPTLIE